MRTYKVVRRDPVWHRRDEAGNVTEMELLETGYDGDDLFAAAVDLDARRLLAAAGTDGQWSIETDDPDYQGEAGEQRMDRDMAALGVEESNVYDYLTLHLSVDPDEARSLLGWPAED